MKTKDNYVMLKLGRLNAEDIATETGGEIVKVNGGFGGDVGNLTIDSRVELNDGIFVAIAGESFDGHDYIADVIRKGLRIIIASRLPDIPGDVGGADIVIVPDTVKALGALANQYMQKSKALTVAVTGSVGKTTTKELIASTLAVKYKTHKTAGNKNNEIGLPLTALSLEPDTERAVFECGMSGFHEIEYLTSIVRPSIGVITNIGTSHMEMLGSRENIAKAKLEILSGMKDDGILIINADEPLLTNSDQVKNHKNVVTAALYNRNADYRAVNIRSVGSSTVFDVIYNGIVSTNVEIPLLGTHTVYDALYAFAIGIISGESELEIKQGLSSYETVSMRQNIYDIGDITVIEDCYNASPESMRAEIDVLCTMAKERGVRATALLGDMRELGEYSSLMHEQLGIYAARAGIRVLYTYGPLSENIARAAITNGIRAENVYVNVDCGNPKLTGDMIIDAVQPGDILLVKASRAVAAEEVIDYLKRKLQ